MAVPITIQELKDKIDAEVIPNNNRDIDAIKMHDILLGTANLLGAVSGSFTTSGTTGTSGTNNTSGLSGTSGTSGISGSSGTSGTAGTSGTTGTNNTSGISFPNGLNGTSGISSTSGIDGGNGTSGINGTSGTSSTSGTGGFEGSSGTSGITDGTSGTSGTTPNLSGVIVSSSFNNYTASIFFTSDSEDIDFSGSGNINNPLSASLNLSSNSTQGIQKFADGLFYPNLVKNGLIFGGIVTWITGFTYNVSPATYYINSILHNSPSTNIILSGSDPTNNRFDSIFVNNSGSVAVIQGIPSSNPQIPTGNSLYQLYLTSVLVTAGSSQPVTSQLYVYRENTDWSGSRSTTRINLSSSVLPYSGSLNIEATSTQTGDFFVYTSPSGSVNVVGIGYNAFIFNISPKIISPFFSPTTGISIQFYSASITSGQSVNIFQNSFGLSPLSTTYQRIVIPLSNFGLISGDLINKVRFTTAGGNLSGYHIDDIQFQGASVPIVTNLNLNVTSSKSMNFYGDGSEINPLSSSIKINIKNSETIHLFTGSISLLNEGETITGSLNFSQNPNSKNYLNTATILFSGYQGTEFRGAFPRNINKSISKLIYKMPDGNLNDNLDSYTISGDWTGSSFTLSKSFKYDKVSVSGSSTPNVESYFYINKQFTSGKFRAHLKVKVEATSSNNPILGFRGITPTPVSTFSSPTAFTNFAQAQVYMYLNLSGSDISHGSTANSTSWDSIYDINNISGSISPGDVLDMYYEVSEREFEKLTVVINGLVGRETQKRLLYDARIHAMHGYRGIIMSGGTYTIMDYSIESVGSNKPKVALVGDSQVTGNLVQNVSTIRTLLEVFFPFNVALYGSSSTTTKGMIATMWELLDAEPEYVFISNYINGLFWQEYSSSDAYHDIFIQDITRQTAILRKAGIKIIWFAPLPSTTIPVVGITANTCQQYYNFLTGSFPQDFIVTLPDAATVYDASGFHYDYGSNNYIAETIKNIISDDGGL